MKFRTKTLIFFFTALCFLLSTNQSARSSTQTPNLSFQADIYGGAGLEAISYNADLSFQSYGGFGTNSHVVSSFLTSGDQVAYAVSYNNPNSFTLDVSPRGGEVPTATLVVTKSQYSTGTVTLVNPNELHFSWEIIQEPYHLILHKKAILLENQDLTANYMFQESFSVENLGNPVDLHKFTEFLHMDDISRLRDFDSDGLNDTLLAVNNFSTSGYPVFGKINLRRQSISVEFADDGRYAQISYKPFYRLILTNGELEVSKSAYVTSLAKDGSSAESQVLSDAVYLLLIDRPCEIPYFSQVDERWSGDPMACEYPYNTFGRAGCAITSSAMVVSTYGDFLTPGELNTQLGEPCLIPWGNVYEQHNENGIDGHSIINISQLTDTEVLNLLDAAINIDKTPVILGLSQPTTGYTHYVLVVSGQGANGNDYTIHDPAHICGANISLGEEYLDDWEFDWMIIYYPFISCRTLTPLTPECTTELANAVPVEFGVAQNNMPNTYINASITSDMQIFTLLDNNVYISLSAESETGNVTQMLVWSDTQQNSHWQDYAPLVYLPKSEFVFARFMDDDGNVSHTFEKGLFPNNPEGLNYQFFMPSINR